MLIWWIRPQINTGLFAADIPLAFIFKYACKEGKVNGDLLLIYFYFHFVWCINMILSRHRKMHFVGESCFSQTKDVFTFQSIVRNAFLLMVGSRLFLKCFTKKISFGAVCASDESLYYSLSLGSMFRPLKLDLWKTGHHTSVISKKIICKKLFLHFS